MEGWILVIVGVVAFALLLAFSLCKVSGDCSRQEEREEMERWKNGRS